MDAFWYEAERQLLAECAETGACGRPAMPIRPLDASIFQHGLIASSASGAICSPRCLTSISSDCLYALQATIPHLTRSSPQRSDEGSAKSTNEP
jgi:hypothetical protein